MATAVESAGKLLAERLGLSLPKREGHDLTGPCIACESSDGFRVHGDTGVAFCFVCGVKLSPLQLCERLLGEKSRAISLMEERNGTGHVNGVAADPVDVIARQKGCSADALRAFGARAIGPKCIEFPAYGPDGRQCTNFRMDVGDGKGKFEKDKPAGLFFPHEASGDVRLPKAGEIWHGVEGPKDAAALHSLGLLAFGMNTCRLAAKFARLFAGVNIVMVPDRDQPGQDGAECSASVLFGVASSVRLAALPAEFRATKGPDVRDVLREKNGRELVLQAIVDSKAWTGGPPKEEPPKLMDGNGAHHVNGHHRATAEPRHFNATDLGNAERFVARYRGDVRYCAPWKTWLIWDGCRWKPDESCTAERFAQDVVRSIWREASECEQSDRRNSIGAWAAKSESAERISAMLKLARARPGIPVVPIELDSNPWLFNCANGIIDLKTGMLLSHDRKHMLTKRSPVELPPGNEAECPLWEGAIDKIFVGDAELIGFVRRLLGAALVGEVIDHVLPIWWGGGSNGKSLVTEIMLEIFGEYGDKASAELLLVKQGQSHPTEKADLFGKRLVFASETDEGRRLSEALAKEVTGGDTIKARWMRQDFFSFKPSHTVVLVTNHKPRVRGTDHGIWRRLRLVPFVQRFWDASRGETGLPEFEADTGLRAKLSGEHGGVLNWLVQGCLEWQQIGLGEPEQVRMATANYRAAEDVLAAFIADCCILEAGKKCMARDLRNTLESWCKDNGEKLVSGRRLGEFLSDKGVEKRTSNGTVYEGLAIKSNTR